MFCHGPNINFARPLPLFPLPGVVLLPHATVPLYIFEPRYRAMTRDALESSKLIAMATFSGTKWRSCYGAAPPIRPHVCVGRIVRHQELADGRFNLLLQGVSRARVVEELPHEPYRHALLEPFENTNVMEIDLTEQRQRLETLLRSEPLTQLASVASMQSWLSSEVPTVALVDLFAMTICDNVEQRYDMLANPCPFSRSRWLQSQLQHLSRVLRIADRLSPPQTGDHLNLN